MFYMVESEQIYQLYLSLAMRYAVAHFAVFAIAVIIPFMLWLIYAFRVRSKDDGLPTTRAGGVYIVTTITITIICVLLAVYSIAAAIPPLITPQMWALEHAAAMCFVR